MRSCPKYFSACLLALLTQAAFAQSAPTLGAASAAAVLGGAGVTCTASTITGGVDSLLTVTQTPTCSIVGPIHQGDATATQAHGDFLLAYQQLAAIPCPADAPHNLSGDLGGKVLSPGIYCISGVGLLTSQLTLNGPSNGIWIFKAATSLTPIAGSVVMAGGGQACNVYWQLGTAASLDATDFLGNILAGSAITFTGVGSSLLGRALAQTAVTTTGASINGDCTSRPGPGHEPLACSDRITGGGYIQGSNGKANFGVTGRIAKGALRGHLTYIDHGTDLRVKGTGVTSYVALDAKTRRIEGTASINGVAGTYKVVVSDNGERGRNDSFAITLSNGYSALGKLAGGNIQLHKRDCHKTVHGRAAHDDDDDDDRDGEHGDDGQERGKRD